MSRFTRYSASYFLLRQNVFVVIGAVLVLLFDIPALWGRVATGSSSLSPCVLIVAVLIPGIGRKGQRCAIFWIPLGPFSLQPSG